MVHRAEHRHHLPLEVFCDGQSHVLAGLAKVLILNEAVVQRFLEDVADHLVDALLADRHEELVALAEDLAQGNVAVEERVSARKVTRVCAFEPFPLS